MVTFRVLTMIICFYFILSLLMVNLLAIIFTYFLHTFLTYGSFF
jgi:hypothetical protein